MANLHISNLLLASLPDEDFARLAPLLTAVPLKTRTVFMREGHPIESVCFPQGGVCSLTLTMGDGRMAEIGVVGLRRPTATLVAGTLQRAGLIRYTRARMEIMDRQASRTHPASVTMPCRRVSTGCFPARRPSSRSCRRQ